MAASIIGALRAVLGLDTAQFEQNADRASAKSGVLKRELMGMASAIGGMVAPAALATAGVAAFAKGMEAAQAAMDFADELDATATKIGVTAEALQELRFAAQDADIDASAFDVTLQSLNATLGAMKTGIGDAKVREAFEKLGITDDQLTSMRDATDLLPLLADRISKVGTQAEQVKIAKKLGIEDMLPLLQRGAQGISDLRTEAQDLGVVLDSGVVSHMADLSREVEKADGRMAAASATIGNSLAPAFVTLKNATADAFNALAEYIDRFREVENRATTSLEIRRDKAYREMSKLIQNPLNGYKDGKLHGPIGAMSSADYEKWKRTYEETNAELERRREAARTAPAPTLPSGKSGGLSEAGKTKAKKQGSEWADLFDQARKARQDYNENKAVSDKVNGAAMGEVIATEANGIKITEMISNAAEDGLGEGLTASRQTVFEAYRDTFGDAFEAGLRGGSKGVLQWLGFQLERSLVDSLSSIFAKSAAGSSGWGAMVGSLFGIGNNADGTTNWRGGMTWVGERGPELLSLPRGAAITPAHMVDAAGGGMVISVTPSELFDVAVRKVSREEAQSAAVQSTQAGMGLAQEQQARAAFTRIR